jgi:hypothetical protein
MKVTRIIVGSLITGSLTLAGLGIIVSKVEAQSQSTVGCPHCDGMSRPSNRISEGVFKFDGRPAIYYSNGRGEYCSYGSWDNLVRLTGKRNPTWSTLGTNPRLSQYNMRYAGICTGGVSRPAPHPDPNF